MDLKEKIKNLILEYRTQSQGSTPLEREESGFIRFDPPLQAELIWIERRKHDIDFQILVFTKWEDLVDLEIIIHGPFKFKNRERYITELDFVAHSEKWLKRYFPNLIKTTSNEPDELPYSKIYEEIIAEAKDLFFILFYDYLLTDKYKKPYIFPGRRHYKNIFYWIIFGKIQDLNIKEYVKKELDRWRKDVESRKEIDKIIKSPLIKKRIEEQKQNEINGYGTFFYPPIWIGDKPDQSIEDKLTGQTVGSYIENVIKTSYKGRVLLIQNDGYIAIEEKDEEIAIELLNEIMGTAVLNNLGAYVIRKSEIGRMTIDSRTWKLSFYTTPPNSKHQILERERRKSYRSRNKIMRTPYTIEKVKKIIQTAEKITKNKDIKTYLMLYLESFTFFYNTVYTQSFLMSWFILEKYLNMQCENLKKRNDLDIAIKRFLENNYWKPAVMMKSLYRAGEISIDELNYYKEVKNTRNCIVHENLKCSYKEVEKFKRHCAKLIKDLIKSINFE